LHLVETQSVGRRAAQVRAAGVAGAALALAALVGCGNTYRPVVSAINPVGPAGQPNKYVVAISSPAPVATTNGLVTIVDFSGDTVLATPSIGVNPYYFNVGPGGNTGYTLNGDKTVNTFDISPSLQTINVLQTTLLPGANPVSVFSEGGVTYLPEPGRSSVAQLNGTPPALKQELPVGANPSYVVGLNGAPRAYALSQGIFAAGQTVCNSTNAPGTAAAIELTGNTISATLPVGKCPIYGIFSPDARRAFILNQGDGTVTVVNTQTNMLDVFAVPTATTTPAPTTSTIPVGTAPLWADSSPTRSEIVVLNGGTGTTPGSLSIINIPLCSSSVLNDPNCSSINQVDATGFGQVLATVPVGVNPVVVSVLSDGTRAYVANAGTGTLPCSTTPVAGVSEACTVSVVNLTTNTVTATIPIAGHPKFLATSNASPTGKVYVVCNDSTAMTVIRTDEDVVSLTIPLQGLGVSVRVTQP
jgi:YVTN family beta-propeller protein